MQDGNTAAAAGTQDMRQTAACTLNIPGNLSGRFIIVCPLLNTPPPPSPQPRWTSQRFTFCYAGLFDYVRLRGLFGACLRTGCITL